MTDAPARHFASDNNAGVHPEILAAIAAANVGHVPGYGDDPYTRRAEAAIRALLGEDARAFFTFNGTGANVVALAAVLRPHQAVICPQFAHIAVDECGAFERFAGGKLIDVPVADGKLTPADVEACLHGIGDPHHVQPAAISISQSTEVGTVYTVPSCARWARSPASTACCSTSTARDWRTPRSRSTSTCGRCWSRPASTC